MRIIISGGGSGGHVYPAIAIANALKSKGVTDILFVGAKDKMEMIKVPQAGYKIEGLKISGFHRSRKWRNIGFPFKLFFGLIKAKKIIDNFKPDVVIGVGGFASGPTLKVAQFKNIPTVIQEQNSFPGITNKLLASSAKKIFVAYNGMEKFFPQESIIFSGNPVRKDLYNIESLKAEAAKHFELDESKKTILVMGGSLGARSLNEAMLSSYDKLRNEDNVQVIWQVGKLYYDEINNRVRDKADSIKILPFIDKMKLAYSIADIVVSRSGALTISELSIVGKPCILVPSPNVAEDHQTKNANALVETGAAFMVPDSQANEKLFDETLLLLSDSDRQSKMSDAIIKLAKPSAVDEITDGIIKLANHVN